MAPRDNSESSREAEEKRWISTSPSALDRIACKYLRICGGVNWLRGYFLQPRPLAPIFSEQRQNAQNDYTGWWRDPSSKTVDLREKRRRGVPDYVFEYAPFVYLHERERFWPSDVAEHLDNCHLRQGDEAADFELRLNNLDDLGSDAFITSNDDPEALADWMLSRHNIPASEQVATTPGKKSGKIVNDQAGREGWGLVDDVGSSVEDEELEAPAFEVKIPYGGEGSSPARLKSASLEDSHRSNAPAFLIVIDKGNGIIDAFWFFFYSYNEGNKVFGITFGNHVGDWEHVMVRFQRGQPKALYLSRHAWGSVYTYEAMEKIGKRPVVYSADGSHAHYPTPGQQNYILPFGLLHDVTSRGPLWDPAANVKSFVYDLECEQLLASVYNLSAPTSWFHFAGRWGDKIYDLCDKRQYRFFGEAHFSTGPLGPKFKHLARRCMCEGSKCQIKDYLD